MNQINIYKFSKKIIYIYINKQPISYFMEFIFSLVIILYALLEKKMVACMHGWGGQAVNMRYVEESHA